MSDIEIYSLPGTTQLLCAKIPAAVAAASGELRIMHDGALDLPCRHSLHDLAILLYE